MRCVAVGCKTGRKSGLRIHSFPRDPKRRLEWAVKVNIAENGKLWVPPKDCCYGVCELFLQAHFEEDQYEPRRTDRKLKPFAIPTLFSHRKVPKRRRMLVRGNPAENSSAGTTASFTGAGAVTPTSTVATSQQAGLCSAAWAQRAAQSTVTSREPAFTVATSGGNIILVPATTLSQNQGLIIDQPPVAVQARATTGVNTITVATSNKFQAVNPRRSRCQHKMLRYGQLGRTDAFTSVPVPRAAAAPARPQNIVLPPLGCLPNAGPIILVPMSQPSLLTAVPRAMPEQSSAVRSAVPGQGGSPPMPVILSVESLSGKASSVTSGVVGPPPLIARPPTYDELRREVTTLKQQSADLRRDICEAARQAARVKAALSRQSERLSHFLRADQVERLVQLPGDAPVRWTEPTLRFALDIYRCSPKAYRTMLAAHYPLPSERALRAFCVEHGVQDGVPPELLLQAEPGEEDGANIVWL
ncbi:uncharacterized protein LOC144112092 isoform X3 [Amblyomma americanum]